MPSSSSTKKKMSLDGAVYIVRLLEIDLKKVQYDQQGNLVWPPMGKDSSVPSVDGVLALHDATQPDQLAETTELIGRFMKPDNLFQRNCPRYPSQISNYPRACLVESGENRELGLGSLFSFSCVVTNLSTRIPLRLSRCLSTPILAGCLQM